MYAAPEADGFTRLLVGTPPLLVVVSMRHMDIESFKMATRTAYEASVVRILNQSFGLSEGDHDECALSF